MLREMASCSRCLVFAGQQGGSWQTQHQNARARVPRWGPWALDGQPQMGTGSGKGTATTSCAQVELPPPRRSHEQKGWLGPLQQPCPIPHLAPRPSPRLHPQAGWPGLGLGHSCLSFTAPCQAGQGRPGRTAEPTAHRAFLSPGDGGLVQCTAGRSLPLPASGLPGGQ